MSSLSIKITNMRCDAKCGYCYEGIGRDMPSKTDRPLNIPAVLKQMDYEWQRMTQMYGPENMSGEPYLHGGEALLAGHETVEKIMKKAYELAGRTNIQTYGYLIDDKYIEIFKKYKASVGISIDGPWPLNKARPVSGMSTKAVTELVHKNILRLREEDINVSIICVLTKANATPDKLPQLKEWLLWLRDIGVNSGRLNLAHMDLKQYGKGLELTEEEAENAWRELTKFVLIEEEGLYWQPMHDAVSSMLGLEQGTCVFNECEYFHASAEPVVLSDGSTANCLKTAKTGNMYPRLEQPEYESRGFGRVRYEVLQQIPFELSSKGGCKGCTYWRNCLGGCPAEGTGGDWRNKTRFCRAYYGLFEEAHKALKRLMPTIITTADATDAMFDEQQFGRGVRGMNPPAFARMLSQYTKIPSSWRGSSYVPLPTKENQDYLKSIEHLDGPIRHLDSNMRQNHGDSHGDHNDAGRGVKPRKEQIRVIKSRLAESELRIKEMKENSK